MSARVRVMAAAAATMMTLALTGGVATATGSDTLSRGAVVPAFYNPPKKLPKANGALVRTEKLPLPLNLPGSPLPRKATRLMYKTTDVHGRPAAVTGVYLEPSVRWRGRGPRPLVVLAPGTMGQGDQCAPSIAVQNPLYWGVQGDQQTTSAGYENIPMYRLLAEGIAVVQTDYIGLGTTDRIHTYVHRVEQAHAVLDAARAARALTGTTVTRRSPVGLFGYSQGGGATAAAAELARSYAPELPLKVTYAGAPTADLAQVTKGIDGSELVAAIGWAVNGFVQADPSLRPLLDRYLNEAGQLALWDASTMCTGDAVLKYAYARSSSWTKTGQTVSQVVAGEPALRKVFAQQKIGTRKPSGAVLVATGANDNLVPHGQARQLAVDWCARKADVTYLNVDSPNFGLKLLNHFGPAIAGQGAAVDYVVKGLSGKPARSNCAKLPSLK